MRKVTAIIIGAGQRGRDAYGVYALHHPEEFQIVGVAEPNEERRKIAAEMFKIPEENVFTDYKEVFAREKFADCVLVCTQDQMHYEPTLMAFEKGYHVLCEKPMSVSQNEIVEMAHAAKAHNRVMMLGYVLRYAPFFVKLKKMLSSGFIGDLVNVQYIENVGYWHHAHSFVRGNWRNSEESCPMILAKCCHDMDMLGWLLGSACKKVQSFGNLTYFKEENAPEGAPAYCLDGCPHRDTCPYYAPMLYLEHPKAYWFSSIISEDTSAEGILKALEKGPYGRCVFRCDNDVVDHQIVNMEYENGVHVSFTMGSFTKECCREINFMGTKGQIKGDMGKEVLEYYDFITGHTETIQIHRARSGHGGSDSAMMKAFVEIITKAEETGEIPDTEEYIDSHILAFAAEESRLSGKVIELEKYKNGIMS